MVLILRWSYFWGGLIEGFYWGGLIEGFYWDGLIEGFYCNSLDMCKNLTVPHYIPIF